MEEAIWAKWSRSYLSIHVHIPYKFHQRKTERIILNENQFVDDCTFLFDAATMVLLSSDANCFWIKNKNQARLHGVDESVVLVIDLSPNSAININDALIFKDGDKIGMNFYCQANNEYSNVIIPRIQHPHNPYPPQIILSSTSTSIGVCDDLILDARSTTFMGGRSDGQFIWSIARKFKSHRYSNTYFGSYMKIGRKLLNKLELYNISVTATNWYNETSVLYFNVYVYDEPVPIVSLSGTHIYKATRINLNGYIDIYSDISIDTKCLTNTAPKIGYFLSWHADVSKLYDDDDIIIDAQRLLDLNLYLSTNYKDMNAISVYADKYLQPGLLYTFALNLVCVGGNYVCNSFTTHRLKYHYADLKCAISGTDVRLYNADPELDNLNNLQLPINGLTLTWDPDQLQPRMKESKKNIVWSWQCMDLKLNVSCNHFMNNISTSIANVDFANMHLDYSSSYSFEFIMNVVDGNNHDRNCHDSFKLDINTTNSENTTNQTNERMKLFIVQLSSYEDQVNVRDRVGLMGHIENYDQRNLVNVYFEWYEVNGLLNRTEIQSYRENLYSNSIDLMLKPNALKRGKLYSFKLVVTQYRYPLNTNSEKRRLSDQEIIGYGESLPKDIYVFDAAIIHHNSFQIDPQCVNVYESIHELLATTHILSISADDDYVPLLYQFGYNTDDVGTHYFHALLLTNAYIHDLYLPLGSFTIFGNVINDKSSINTAYIECSITLLNYSKCIVSWKAKVIETYFKENEGDITFSTDDKYFYIFYQTNAYLNYLQYHYIPHNNDDECIKESIAQILFALDEYIGLNDMCSVHKKWIISLSQTMSLLLTLINQSNYTDTFYADDGVNNYLKIIQNLLTMNLDPCGCIRRLADIQDLYLMESSIITKIPSIYYKNESITDCLPPIISNSDYHQLLYAESEPILELIKKISYNESIDLYNLLVDAIYITKLTVISTVIPGTKICEKTSAFSSCAVRFYDECNNDDNISLSVGNSTVHIVENVTCHNGDIVIVNMDGMVMKLPTDQSEANSECESQVIDNAISILTSSANSNQSEFKENVLFSFQCHQPCDESVKCVWLNKSNDIWVSDGCDTSTDGETNEIICACSHYSAFGTLRTIHNPDACNSDNPFAAEWLSSKSWDIFIWIFFVIFMLIFCYSMICCLYYYFVPHLHRIYIFVIFLIGITALFYAFVCLFAYMTKQALIARHGQNDSNMTESLLQIYALCLLLPQIPYFVILSLVFYSWYSVTYFTLLPDLNISKNLKLIKNALLALNAFFCFFLFIYKMMVICIPVPANTNIFIVGMLLWSIPITLCCLAIVIFSFVTKKLISKHLIDLAALSQGKETNVITDDHRNGMNLLLMINTFIAIYFIILAFTSNYFATNPAKHQTLEHMIAHYVINILFLLFLSFTYRYYGIIRPKKDKIERSLTSPTPSSPPIHEMQTTKQCTINLDGAESMKAGSEITGATPFDSGANVSQIAENSDKNHEISLKTPSLIDDDAAMNDFVNLEATITATLSVEHLIEENGTNQNIENRLEKEQSLLLQMASSPDDDEDEEWKLFLENAISEEEKEENKPKKSAMKIEDLLKIKLIPQKLGNPSTYKLPKDANERELMERDLRKLFVNDEDEKFSKLAVIKYYHDILMPTFVKYCKIGGDSDWLTMKGWQALYRDAFICDEELINQCTEKECHSLFNVIWNRHHNSLSSKKMTLRTSQLLEQKHNKFSTRMMILNEWNDEDPWTGIWKAHTLEEEVMEMYKIKQIGDNKLCGYIKSFDFCSLNGSLTPNSDKTKAEMMIFWHQGARKNKRRLCECTLNKPSSSTDAVTMTVRWKSIAMSSIVDEITPEKGEYILTKQMDERLSNRDEDAFKYKIGLCRHEYLDAMLTLAQMRYAKQSEIAKYAKLCMLCEEHLIPYIWGGLKMAQQETLKNILRPHVTELHRLFEKYNHIDKSQGADDRLLSLREWQVLTADILKQDENAFIKGGKPSETDIISSFEIAKKGFDLALNYKSFEAALTNLAQKIYKRQPKKMKIKYAIPKYTDKLRKILKWSVKLEKSGFEPANINNYN